MSESKNKALDKVSRFLEIVESKIEESIARDVSLPATNLAKNIGPEFGWEWPQAYHIINTYLDEREDLYVKKGPKGGITKKKPGQILVNSSSSLLGSLTEEQRAGVFNGTDLGEVSGSDDEV